MTSVELCASTESSSNRAGEAGEPPRPASGRPADNAARAAILDVIANMTPDELVARLDPDMLARQLRCAAVDIDNNELSDIAVQKYDDIMNNCEDRNIYRSPPPIDDFQVFEVFGSIKWFDASKGYGFIVPDNELPDVLIHVTALRAGGFLTAYEGARLHCEVLARPRGLQVFRILSMDESTAIHPSQLSRRTHVAVEPVGGWQRAVVKWYNRVRGFGFLASGSGQPEIFVHTETLRRFGIVDLRPGQVVQVRLGRSVKGVVAAAIRVDAAVGPQTQ